MVSIRLRYITGVTIERRIFLQIARKEEPTSGLEPLTPAHYERSVKGCWALHTLANPVFLRGFLCPALPTVAWYCVRVMVKLGSRGISTWGSSSPHNGFLAVLELLLG